ncbi:MAG: sigma 54-interacting transcriptional regulator [Thermodesulfobacteriota bacterium]|nr:MAG: sigma 54-interacting transcriptional regulator [Thermodesulfobacteriota bacterium]
MPVKAIRELTFDVVPDPIAILDKEYRIVQVNKAMAKRLGATPEKCIGQYCYACIHDAAEPPVFCPHNRLLQDGQEHTAEVYEPHLGGHFLVTVSPLFNDQRELIGSIHIAHDITERKRTEEMLKKAHDALELKVQERTAELIRANRQLEKTVGELKLTEEKLRKKEMSLTAAQRIAQVGNWDWDIETNDLYWSDEVYRIFGLTLQEFGATYDAFLELVHPDDREVVKEAVNRSLKNSNVPYNIEHRVLRPDDIEHIVHERGEVMFNEKGKPIRMVGVVHDITDLKETENKLRHALDEVQNLKEKIEAENIYLQKEVKGEKGFDEIIGKSNVLNYVFFRVKQVAGTVSTVLLLGETGTGKERIAHAIHNRSPRKEKIFVTVNCAALPSNIIESELFGREKGAFTGSHAKQIGRFELAHGGTIFLDEVGELPLELQSKLLKVVQDGEFERLGNPRTTKVDVRIIASTNRNLEDMVQKGRFREDLYYRLNVFPITIPPLRQRKDDIPLLVEHFTKHFSQKHGIKIKKIPKDVLTNLKDYSWPGNVRELQNVIERAVITSRDGVLRVEKPAFSISGPEDIKPLDDLERDYIHKVLEKTKGRIAGTQGAAILLGMNPSTLRSRLIKLGIKKRGFRSA